VIAPFVGVTVIVAGNALAHKVCAAVIVAVGIGFTVATTGARGPSQLFTVQET
jgi:hypothetical protein